MANTYTLISSVTVGSGGASSIDFTSIPATYTDLQIVLSGRSSFASKVASVYGRFNSSSTGYTNRVLYGETTGTGSFTPSLSYAHMGYISASSTTSNTFGSVSIYIPNYAGSAYKSISTDAVTEDNASTYQSGVQAMVAALWSNTSAITSVSLTLDAGNFNQYSNAYLYGIKNSQENKWQTQKSQLIARQAKQPRQN